MFLNKYVHSTFAYLGEKRRAKARAKYSSFLLLISLSKKKRKKLFFLFSCSERRRGKKNSAAMAAQAEAEEDVRLELEAVAAVYGDDVRVLRDLPPHLVVHVRPRTADDSSQQVRLASPPFPPLLALFPWRPSRGPHPSRLL